MECIQSYITKLECLNDNCVQYSMKHCIPKNKYEGTQRLEDLFVPFAPLTVTEQYPIAYMDIGEYSDDVNQIMEQNEYDIDDENDDEGEESDEKEEEVQEDVCSEQMIDRFLDAVEVKKPKRARTKKSMKQPKNKSKRK